MFTLLFKSNYELVEDQNIPHLSCNERIQAYLRSRKLNSILLLSTS